MIQFDENVCRDLEAASNREWLETNGVGGFASSTIIGMNTRRYHGLLVAATRPPVGRLVLLSKLEETLILDGEAYELSANRYPGVVHPRGHAFLKSFRLDPFPIFTYDVQGLEIEKSVFMAHGQNTTVIQYQLRGAVRSCTLELRPLIAFRDYHATTHENGALDPQLETESGNLKIQPYAGLPALYLSHHGEAREAGVWYRHFEYERERERGLDYREDLFNPCALVADLDGVRTQAVIASTEPSAIGTAEALRASEIERRRALGRSFPAGDSLLEKLSRAADQFLVKRGEGHTIVAGYHWFTDWGRDTMIALPGLTLAAGRPELARSILREFARCANQGMLPNRFPDDEETPEYNTVDATLWFFEAVRAYLAHTGDLEFVGNEIYPTLADIISWHRRGTRFGIHVDEDGLLAAGEPGTQLTWMDAKVGDWVVTPRAGKAVEIQALWYNALRVMEELSRRRKISDGAAYGALAERVKTSFERQFWNLEARCLYDVIDGEHRDASIRPNQIFALSLSHRMLSGERAKQILETVQQHLLTPYGLRTLSPSNTQYRGRYEGGPGSRDGAYHQGTVWPWLMGPFVTAYLNVHGLSAKTREWAAKMISPLMDFMDNQGVGQLPEVFGGDVPHRPGGCISQAWTISEMLRIGVSLYAAPPPKQIPKRFRAQA